jgi:hypothetical protein
MALIQAIQNENLENIKNILSRVSNKKRKINAFQETAKNGSLTLKVFQYLNSLEPNLFNDDLLEFIINYTVINGNLDIYKYTHKPIKTSLLIPEVAENGHIEVLKYLISLDKVPSFILEGAVLRAGENGHLEVVKYLVSLGTYFEATIEFAIKSGDLNLVKYLITTKLCWEDAFQFAFEFGDLETIKYVISLGYESGRYNIAVAAGNGHFQVQIMIIQFRRLLTMVISKW